MADFTAYQHAFPHAALERSPHGVLEVVLHSDGGTLVFDGHIHEEFVELFHRIGEDAANRVVILTGAGEAFIDSIDPAGFDFFSPRGYDKIYRQGKKVLANLLDIPVPVIAALNGPATVHSEYVLLADIVVATPDTVFQDKPHFAFGIVPGDGIHSLWPEVIGSIRGRTFVLTQQAIGAEEARALGVVGEIVPRERLLPRAREIAARIAALPPLTASYTRIALTQKLRRLVDETVGYGLALEGISAADVARSRASGGEPSPARAISREAIITEESPMKESRPSSEPPGDAVRRPGAASASIGWTRREGRPPRRAARRTGRARPAAPGPRHPPFAGRDGRHLPVLRLPEMVRLRSARAGALYQQRSAHRLVVSGVRRAGGELVPGRRRMVDRRLAIPGISGAARSASWARWARSRPSSRPSPSSPSCPTAGRRPPAASPPWPATLPSS